MSSSDVPIEPRVAAAPRTDRRARKQEERELAKRERAAHLTTPWYSTALGLLLLAGRAIWRPLRPVVTTISATGWIVLIVAVAAGATGLILGWQEFVYLSVTLFAALIVALAFIFGRAAYQIEIELTPRRVVAGERALGRLVIVNPRKRTSSPSRLELPVGGGLAEFVVPSLKPNEEHEELFAVPTNRRAVIVAGPAESVRGDQLGILRRVVRWADPVELFVHPVTVPLAPSASGKIRDLEGDVTKTITNSDISFHALRAYEPGDDRRYVHWRTSARTGQLMVRQFEETRRSSLTVLFASDARYYASEDEFELAVSVLASLAAQAIRDSTSITVLTERFDLRTRSVGTMLDDTCRIDRASFRFASARDFARERTIRLGAPNVIMLISGSLMAVSDFRSVQGLFGLDTQALGFRADLGAAPRLAVINGMRIATVGDLGELGRLVRRAS